MFHSNHKTLFFVPWTLVNCYRRPVFAEETVPQYFMISHLFVLIFHLSPRPPLRVGGPSLSVTYPSTDLVYPSILQITLILVSPSPLSTLGFVTPVTVSVSPVWYILKSPDDFESKLKTFLFLFFQWDGRRTSYSTSTWSQTCSSIRLILYYLQS